MVKSMKAMKKTVNKTVMKDAAKRAGKKTKTTARKHPNQLGGGKGSKNAPRMLLISDSLDRYEQVIQSCHDHVVIVPVKYDSWSLKDLESAVEARCGKPVHQYASIGIAEHGAPGQFQLLKKVDQKYGLSTGVDLVDLAKNKELNGFLRNLAGYVKKPRSLGKWQTDNKCRIDLLACSVLGNADGKKLIQELENLTKVNWTASMNVTSSGKTGDWIMESEKHLGSIAPCYFRVQRLKSWRHQMSMADVDAQLAVLRKGGCPPPVFAALAKFRVAVAIDGADIILVRGPRFCEVVAKKGGVLRAAKKFTW